MRWKSDFTIKYITLWEQEMANDRLKMQDPRQQYPGPPFPRQPQPAPGLAQQMIPQPDHGEEQRTWG